MSITPMSLPNEDLLEILTHTKTATAVHVGEQATIRFANQAMLEIWGKNKSVIGKTLEEALPELKGQPFIEMFAKVWREGLTISGTDTPAELIINGKTDTYYFDFEYRAMLGSDGKTIGILHTALDVTERFLKKNAEQQAAITEEFLVREQALNEELSTSNEELAAINEELSAAFEELSASSEQLYQTKEELHQLNEQLEQRVAERIQTIGELNTKLEASAKALNASNEQLAAANEELLATVEELAQSRDYLEQSVIQLAHNEYQTRNIIESTPFPIGVYTGKEMRIAFANRSITDIWGKGENVTGKLYSEILPELSNQSVFDQLDGVYTTGKQFQARNQRIDLMVEGKLKTFYFNYNFTALRNKDGEIYAVMNTAADVTDLVLANLQIEEAAKQHAALNEELAAVNEELTASNEEIANSNEELIATYDRLKISQNETQLAIDAAGLATFDFDPRTGRFSGNHQLKKWFGLEPTEQIELQKATDEIAQADQEKVIAAIAKAMDQKFGGDYDTNYTIINPIDPTPRIVQAKGKALFNEEGQAIRLSGVLQDITYQIQSAEEIKEANNRLKIAIEAGSLGSTEVDLATGKMECNEQFKKCFGRTKDEPFNYSDLFASILPTFREKVAELVKIAKETRSIYQAEYQVSWPDGSIHWISAHGKARYDQDGKAIKMVGIISDITEAKADEQRKNDFIGMVSHELKTPLTSLNGYVQLLHRKAQKQGDDFSTQALEKANNQLRKMTGMINSFLNVSRLESGKIHIERAEFDLTILINELESEFNYTTNNHQLVFLPCGENLVNADREKISHVLSNLISNAVKYSPPETKIIISCNKIQGNIQVALADQGSGISKKDQPHLFERYYRVSDQPMSISGFGIGLYLCAEIINRHNGRIWVESELGKGSTFYFNLPITE